MVKSINIITIAPIITLVTAPNASTRFAAATRSTPAPSAFPRSISRCGSQSDVWALGIVLLELLLQRFPYSLADADDGVDYLDLLDSISSQEARSRRGFACLLSRDLLSRDADALQVPIPSREEAPHATDACLSFLQVVMPWL